MVNLDDLELLKKTDPEDMLGHIARLPEQCAAAWESGKRVALPDDYRHVQHVVVLGLGGSAIGADLVRTVVQQECPVPMSVNRDYLLPEYVGPHTLAIASSHSGKTEEILTTAQAALAKGARVVAITTGGDLAEWATARGLPLLRFTYSSQPRAALGYSFSLVLTVLCKVGLVPDKDADMREAIAVMRDLQAEIGAQVPAARNAAKQMAQWLYGGLPVVYGAGYLSEVARRWKGQFNENAKSWAFFEKMPELSHNAVAGYRFPADLRNKMRVVLLCSSLDHPQNQKRFRVTREVLEREGVPYHEVQARGRSPLAQLLSTVHLGDYVSYYLAILYGADPTPIDAINYLKGRLAAQDVNGR